MNYFYEQRRSFLLDVIPIGGHVITTLGEIQDTTPIATLFSGVSKLTMKNQNLLINFPLLKKLKKKYFFAYFISFFSNVQKMKTKKD